MIVAGREHEKMITVARWNKECSVVATAGQDKKIIVKDLLFLTNLALGS